MLAVVIFGVFALAAVVGIFIPILPGVPLAAVGALLAAWLTGFDGLGVTPLLVVAALTLLALLVDYVAGLIGARRFGASRAGVWGSVLGALTGLFLLPPFGFLIGALAGAVVGELLSGRKPQDALRAGLGVFVGTLGGMVTQALIVIAIGFVVFPRLV
ncbi:MAG TPA: DUF456 family protein [Chloroflexota bacterium]|nr:DUF456 family protein [Chloroflexota bacterium]